MPDSRTTWMKEVPKEWRVTTIGSLYTLRNEKVSDKEYPPLSVTMKGIVPQLDSAAKTEDGDNRKLVRIGDFAINSRSDRRGSCGISAYDGSVSLINTVLVPREKMHPGYYNWLFHSSAFSDEFYKWGHGIVDDLWTTRWQEMKRIVVPVPSLPEQEAIAAYLDEQCTLIDDAIAEAKTSIDEYKTWRASIIVETTTTGLNVNATKKESSLAWIHLVPKHWQTFALHQLVYQVKNKNKGLSETNLLSLSYGKIRRKDINTTDGLLPASFDGYNIIDDGDIVLRLTDLQNDHTSLRVGIATERGIITSAYTTLRPYSKANAKYLFYLLHSFDILKGFYGMGSGVRQGLNYDEVKELKVILPPQSEQDEISTYLDEKCNEIDAIIVQKQMLISDLEAYKRSLIFEAVTGKRKVVQ